LNLTAPRRWADIFQCLAAWTNEISWCLIYTIVAPQSIVGALSRKAQIAAFEQDFLAPNVLD